MAREAEERERIAKAAKKAKQENEAALESSPKASTAVVSVAESTSHEAVDLTGRVTMPCFYSSCLLTLPYFLTSFRQQT